MRCLSLLSPVGRASKAGRMGRTQEDGILYVHDLLICQSAVINRRVDSGDLSYGNFDGRAPLGV
jgi:hypothetical protein